MDETVEEICAGHIAHRNKRCHKCVADGYNKQCENYHPIYFLRIIVGEAVCDEGERQEYKEGDK